MERKVSAIIPSLAPETSDLQLGRVLDPARFFDRPGDVLAAPDLDLHEKRAILSSCENGGEKVDHGSGGIVPLRAA
ncbi:MAG: hypothetical protein DCC69_04150 [Hyphomicrobiales bacterium]|nr:MAG: hypothetical protein DCC69_04150 [Hyphomicrobiales bacterium]